MFCTSFHFSMLGYEKLIPRLPKETDFVTLGFTDWLNGFPNVSLTKKNREFLKRCYIFVKREKRSFCFLDFEKQYSHSLFRQRIRHCRQFIQIEQKGKPYWYGLRGITLTSRQKPVTHKPTGAGPNMLHNYLESLESHALKIHDIAVKFHDSNLHRMLVENGRQPHPDNQSITLKIPISELDVPVKALIYPKTIQIHIANSHNPIIHDYYGVLGLSVILGRVSQSLSSVSGNYRLPDVKMWIIYHYHLHIDRTHTKFSKKSVEVEMEEFSDTLLRFYTKLIPNGTVVDRFEKIKTSKKTVGQEFSESLFSEDEQL